MKRWPKTNRFDRTMDTEFAVFIAVGVVSSLIGALNFLKIFLRSNWAVGEAKIVDSRLIVETTTYYNLKSKTRPTNWVKTTSYTPSLSSEYTVDGNQYLGSNVFSAPLGHTTPSDVLKFTFGSDHPVWYNPKRPHKAYLRQSPKVWSILLVVLAAFSILHAYKPSVIPKHVSEMYSLLEAKL